MRSLSLLGLLALCVAEPLSKEARRRAVFKLRKDEKYDEALELLQEQVAETLLSSDTIRGEVQEEIGDIYRTLGRHTDAVASYERATTRFERVFGSSPATYYGKVANKLADAHLNAGEPAKAMDLFVFLANSMEKAFGKKHPAFGAMIEKVGTAALASGDATTAVRAYSDLLAQHDHNDGSDEAKVGRASDRLKMARALSESGDPAAALEHAEEALQMYSNGSIAHAGGHVYALNGMASVLEKMGREAEAITKLDKAIALVGDAPDADNEGQRMQKLQKSLGGLRAKMRAKKKLEKEAAKEAMEASLKEGFAKEEM